MDLRRLAYLDVASLMLIKTVFEEKSISKAGKRLSLSQSALSKTLAKLRHLFEDDLFIRVGNEMLPTPKANELYVRCHDILSQLNDLFDHVGFDPVEDEYTFRVICDELVSEFVVPTLISKLGLNGSLEMLEGAGTRSSAHIETAVDFIFEVTDCQYSRCTDEKDTITIPIGVLSHKVLLRSGHPLLDRGSLQLRDLLEFPKVQASFLPTMWSDDADCGQFLQLYNARRAVVETPSMSTALECVRNSNSVMIAPVTRGVGLSRPGLEMLRTARLRHDIRPAALGLRYSAMLRNSRPHAWFVATVQESFREALASDAAEN